MTKKEIAQHYADENTVRLTAAQVVIITSLSLWQGLLFPFLFLSVDFALRGLTHLPSPLAIVSRMVSRSLKLKPHPIFAAPKKFAATIGSVFSLAIFALLYLDRFAATYTIGSVLILFAFLESALKICVGCYVYDWLIAPIINRRNTGRLNFGTELEDKTRSLF